MIRNIKGSFTWVRDMESGSRPGEMAKDTKGTGLTIKSMVTGG